MINVLLVEDDAEIARIIRYFLSGSGEYSVVWAATAQDAVIASRDWFDIILLDVMLPDESGVDLCSRLREWHRCPIIFLRSSACFGSPPLPTTSPASFRPMPPPSTGGRIC